MESVLGLAEVLPRYESDLKFLIDDTLYDEQKPYHIDEIMDQVPDDMRTNLVFEAHNVQIHDIRHHEHKLRLSKHGVQVFKHTVDLAQDHQSAQTTHDYMSEMAVMLQSELEADFCIAYGYRYRDASTHHYKTTGEKELPDEAVDQVHIDQTRKGGQHRARHHLTLEEAAKFLGPGYRLQILNAWRPLYHDASTHPLAFCDPASVDQTRDFIEADRIGLDYAGEVYYLKHRPEHKWYTLVDQRPDEMLVFVSYDSTEQGAKIGFVPHASFQNDHCRPGQKARQSIELRLLLATAI